MGTVLKTFLILRRLNMIRGDHGEKIQGNNDKKLSFTSSSIIPHSDSIQTKLKSTSIHVS